MSFKTKHIKKILFTIFFLILLSCQLQEASKNHGVVFLENRAKKLKINVSNTNDVINIFGQPHSRSISDENEWIYIERILTKGEFHKIGQNVLKSNNILVLKFDKYGVLKNKKLLNKEDKNKISFSQEKTENELTKKSFVEKFLNSVKQKMYGNR